MQQNHDFFDAWFTLNKAKVTADESTRRISVASNLITGGANSGAALSQSTDGKRPTLVSNDESAHVGATFANSVLQMGGFVPNYSADFSFWCIAEISSYAVGTILGSGLSAPRCLLNTDGTDELRLQYGGLNLFVPFVLDTKYLIYIGQNGTDVALGVGGVGVASDDKDTNDGGNASTFIGSLNNTPTQSIAGTIYDMGWSSGYLPDNTAMFDIVKGYAAKNHGVSVDFSTVI
jgi:hypothetical protein